LGLPGLRWPADRPCAPNGRGPASLTCLPPCCISVLLLVMLLVLLVLLLEPDMLLLLLLLPHLVHGLRLQGGLALGLRLWGVVGSRGVVVVGGGAGGGVEAGGFWHWELNRAATGQGSNAAALPRPHLTLCPCFGPRADQKRWGCHPHTLPSPLPPQPPSPCLLLPLPSPSSGSPPSSSSSSSSDSSSPSPVPPKWEVCRGNVWAAQCCKDEYWAMSLHAKEEEKTGQGAMTYKGLANKRAALQDPGGLAAHELELCETLLRPHTVLDEIGKKEKK